MNELERIVGRTRDEVARRSAAMPLLELERAAERRRAEGAEGAKGAEGGDGAERTEAIVRRGFSAALTAPGLALIAEHKRRSPSAGLIRRSHPPVSLEDVVGAYERAGSAALSILTEEHGFGGSIADLVRARDSSSLPILRKDFIVDEYQLVEASLAGADAILLIVAALEAAELTRLHARALALDLEVLVEVHDAAEVDAAVALGAAVIGINNRDLTTLAVDTGRTPELLARVPLGTVTVSESGWRTRSQLEALADAGVDAVLVGEALMRSPDIELACRGLAGVGR